MWLGNVAVATQAPHYYNKNVPFCQSLGSDWQRNPVECLASTCTVFLHMFVTETRGLCNKTVTNNVLCYWAMEESH